MKKWLIALFVMLILCFVVIGLKTGVEPDKVIHGQSADTSIHYLS